MRNRNAIILVMKINICTYSDIFSLFFYHLSEFNNNSNNKNSTITTTTITTTNNNNIANSYIITQIMFYSNHCSRLLVMVVQYNHCCMIISSVDMPRRILQRAGARLPGLKKKRLSRNVEETFEKLQLLLS